MGVLILLAVHLLWDRKASLRKPSLHFLVWKWFLPDPDKEFCEVIHFENLNSLGLPLSLSSVQGDQQTKAPRPAHSFLSTPGTQMWMKKGIMLERQLGKGEGKRVEGEGEGEGNKTQAGFTSKKCSLGKEGGDGFPALRAPRVCLSFSKSVSLSPPSHAPSLPPSLARR